MGWWRRLFRDRSTGKAVPPEASGPRRREHERFTVHTRVVAKCSSWPRFLELLTGDVSAGGLFIPTAEPSTIGEKIEIDLSLPDGQRLPMTGTVVNIIDAEQGARLGQRPGLGVKLDAPSGDARPRFHQLLSHALAQLPVPPPAVTPPTGTPPADVTAAPPAAPTPAAPAVHRGAIPIIGIDMGTSYTAVSAAIGKKVTLFPWPDGARSAPTVIHFPARGKVVVGAQARACLATDPLHTVGSPKRLLGRRYDDPEIQSWLGSAPYHTLAGPDGMVAIELRGEPMAITQLIAYVLTEARQVAERALGIPVSRCVMTCPVSFDGDRSGLLMRAAQLAGLDAVELIDEPTAAALANRFDPGFGGIVGIYDFGGGTFDFSAVDVSRGDFTVLGTAGDTWLGGDDLDQRLAEAVANSFWREHKVDLRHQAVEWQRLLWACEQAKRQLTRAEIAEVHVAGALRTAAGMVDLRYRVDRPTFDKACTDIIGRSLATCDQALELLDLRPDQLQTVYLSGGTTYVPAVRRAVAEHFKVPVHTGVPPEHAVCLGAAIHAAQLQHRAATTVAAHGS